MLIAIPSMARAETHMARLFFHLLPIKWQEDTVLFVPKSEAKAYAAEVPLLKIIPIPDKVKGIIRTRRWIGEWARDADHGKFVMCDDDLLFHTRIAADDWHLAKSTPKQLGQMFDWIEKSLNKHAQVGISSREGNNRSGVGDLKSLTVENTRLLRVYAYQTELFLKVCAVKEVPEDFTMDDFHVTLKLLRSGHSNCQTAWWANDHRSTQDAGGASTYRTFESHNKSAELLAKMHPGFVRLHQKQDKGKFGTRTEVVIAWKKAYEDGKS
jgi:hypothetical protein